LDRRADIHAASLYFEDSTPLFVDATVSMVYQARQKLKSNELDDLIQDPPVCIRSLLCSSCRHQAEFNCSIKDNKYSYHPDEHI
jgi:hypothetical protein